MSQPTLIPKLLTVIEVAQLLRVDRQTIRRYVRSGKIKATMIGGSYKIPKSALRTYCEEKGLDIIEIIGDEEHTASTAIGSSHLYTPNIVTRENQATSGDVEIGT